MESTPIFLTVQVALLTTGILFVIALPLCYWISLSRGWLVSLIELSITLPLILPPTVLGFYLLVVFGEQTWIGGILRTLGIQPLFSWWSIVFASLVYNIPFMMLPLMSGFRAIPRGIHEAARMCGKSSFHVLRKILLPMMRSNILVAVVMTMMHTIGEFGVIMMVGGNIPGETRVISIALYDEVQALNYEQAHWYAGLLFVVSVIALLFVFRLQHEHSSRTLFYARATTFSQER
jgi:molybdate transport system permease protein